MSLHVECSQAGGRVDAESGRDLIWSETVATAGTTAGEVAAGATPVVLTLTAEVDMWVSIGASPNASTNPRRRLKAGARVSFLGQAGDKVAWA